MEPEDEQMTAKRLKNIGVSQTLAISGRAKEMREKEGIDVIDFSLGQPDFNTPDAIKEAGKRAIDENFTRYTQAAGVPELQEAVVQKLQRENGVSYRPENVIISSGAKHSLFNACMALINCGDKVIVPSPYWLSYPPMVYLSSGEPELVQTREEDGFLLTPKALKEAISKHKPRALFLNNPSNPTGMMYSRDQLEKLAEIVVDSKVWVIADEIYEKMVYDGEFVCFASLNNEVRSRTITINGCSKAYSMTGWRVGFAAGPDDIIADMKKIQSQTTSSICSISQKAAIEALAGDQTVVSEMVAEFRKRRDFVVTRLRKVPEVECLMPDGAFYAFPNVTAYYDRLPGLKGDDEKKEKLGSVLLSKHLLENAQVAVVPGIAFGAGDNIRISYATSMEELERGLDKIEKALVEL